MKTFEYVAADAKGRLVNGSLLAVSEAELDRALENRGLILTRAAVATRSRRDARVKLKSDQLIQITSQLATVTGAGVPIVEGLRGIGRRLESESARDLIERMVDGLQGGDSLSEVMEPYGRAFPPVYLASVRAGEASGALEIVLRRIAKYLEWARSMRATTVQALIYPAILFTAIFGLILVLLYYVLPKILGMFPGGHEDLPTETRIVVGLSNFVQTNILWIVGGAIGAVFGLRWGMRNRPGFRSFVHGVMMRVPKLGRVARQIATSKFASTAATLQSAGCDVFTVLEVSASACGNAAMTGCFERVNERVRRGARISQAMDEEPLVDPLLIQMVDVGEKSGALDTCLERLVEYYDDEVPRAVKKFLTILEPAVLLAAGGVVAFILLAALMPIFKLYEQIG